MKLLQLTMSLIVGLVCAVSAEACPWPRKYADLDRALWESARDSGSPSRWVQYYISTGCHKAVAQNLFAPMYGKPAESRPPAAHAVVRYRGKFSGDQTHKFEEAKHGEPLKTTTGGGHLFAFQLFSILKVQNIPPVLYKQAGLPVPKNDDVLKDVALWIRYRCGVRGQPMSDWMGQPGSGNPDAVCPSIQPPHVYERLELELQGPYAQFFDLDYSCERGGWVACTGGGHDITQIKIALPLKAKYKSFLQVASEGHVVQP